MSCDWVDFRLLLHAHEELGGLERWRINRHLRHCATCREQHERFREERRALASCLRVPPVARIADRIALQLGIRRPQTGPRVVVSRRLPMLIMVLAALSAAGAGMVYAGWVQRGDAFAVWRPRPANTNCPYVATPIPCPAPAPLPGKTASP
jgi:anti-sigma factor RsiW